ncbi:MAG: PepSY-associated TM helix domain-containing protein [Pseudomonadota bacterium]
MKAQGFKGSFRQSMAWFHTWVGLVLSVLLYFIFITGTFGYFNAEVDQWMRPEQKVVAPEAMPTRQAMAETGFAYLRNAAPDATRYFISFPTDRNPSLYYYARLAEVGADGNNYINGYIDPVSGDKVAARETGGGDALYEMHYRLHYMPARLALYIVGIATMFMFISLISGIVIHKKIFTDFFTLRLRKGQRSWLDGHNISSVLALPFLLMITYSGLVFYTFDYLPGVAVVSMDISDATTEIREHLAPQFKPVEASGEQAEMISVRAILDAAFVELPAESVRYVSLENRGDKVAEYHIGQHSEGLSRGGALTKFSATTGQLLTDSYPAHAADVVFARGSLALHEGRFANIHLRWLYFLSGLVGAAMVATGMVLWADKRRTRLGKKGVAGSGLKFVERTNLAIIVGLPLGVAAYFWANRLLPIDLEGRADWEMHCLFLMWAASLAHASIRDLASAWREQVTLLALLFAALPVVNAVTTDVHLLATVRAGDWVRASFDLAALAFAAAIWLVARQMSPKVKQALAGERSDAAPVAGSRAGAPILQNRAD